MQTFLPYSNIKKSVECLDNKRLGKQRVEAKQIINLVIARNSKEFYKEDGKLRGFINHPAVLMWEYNIEALMYYHNCCINAWIMRGFKNTMQWYNFPENFEYPKWLGNETFHLSHKSNLLRKDPIYYGKLWNVDPKLPYYWPKSEKNNI
jgi:hypothetical protein